MIGKQFREQCPPFNLVSDTEHDFDALLSLTLRSDIFFTAEPNRSPNQGFRHDSDHRSKSRRSSPVIAPEPRCDTTVPVQESHMASGTKRRTLPPPVPPPANAGVLIGYARVSTEDQKLDLQRDALAQLGCHRVFEDRASGARVDRPGLAAALSHLRPGDTLVV